jgi:uncharacterized membrane protein YtjA (UPF0391 family)
VLIKWILVFLAIVLITAIIGFTGIAVQPILGIARTIFVIFLILFIITVFIHICNDREK